MKKWIKRILWSFLVVFVIMNIVAYFHAYQFTHFDPELTEKTGDAKKLSFGQKAYALFFGISNPRPSNAKKPSRYYETIVLQSNKKIEGWFIPVDSAVGTVALFHGYSGNKSSMLDKAEVFAQLKYNTFLVDFMGSGGSEGNQTTIGYYEAEEVKTVYDFLLKKKEKRIVLFGTSMGAVAIMKAMNDYKIHPSALILECPFGTMKETVKARFSNMGIPSFPMAHLLLFWGGVQNGFNAFKHNPDEYARCIKCPVLLMRGGKDEKVSMEETNRIFGALKGPKKLKVYPEAGHENYLTKYKKDWLSDINAFLESIPK